MGSGGSLRQRYLALAGLAGVTALAWIYLATVGADVPGARPAGFEPAQPRVWQPIDVWFTFIMWGVMMVAMMLPGAAPTILLYNTVSRRQRERGGTGGSMPLFTAGYIVVWAGFSVGATVLQWALHDAGLATPGGMQVIPLIGGAILVAAGAYQWSSLKQACLRHCRSPLDFVLTGWRSGRRGALAMGLEHGAFCLGCCWALMLLLFVGGVMNLLFVAAIAVFVLLEKTLPRGHQVATVTGAVLVGAGVAVLIK